ncbi:Uncharacterised protein [Brucella suis]|nr:Uncharacterised protein [Brucella suis]
MHPALRQFAEGGDLAAKDVEQRCTAGFVQIEHVIAGDGGRIALAVVKQRAHAGEGVQHVFAPELFLEIAVYRGDEIVDFLLIRRNVFRPAFIGNVGGADQRLVTFIWIDEDHALVVVLNEIGVCARPEFRNDDVAALDEAHIARRGGGSDIVDDVRDPWSGAIDDAAGAEGAGFAGIAVSGFHDPAAIFAACGDDRCTGENGRALFGGTHRIERHEARIVHPAIGIFKTLGVLVEDRRAFRVALQIERTRAGKFFAPAQMVIEKQAKPHQPGRAILRAVRQHEAHRPDDMGCRIRKHFALDQRFAHKAELIIFEIAQTAMHQLAGAR